MTSFYRATFWAALALTLVVALLPHPPQVPLTNDKLQHAVAFATLAVLGLMAYPSFSILRLLIALSAFGGLIELLQAIPVLHRDCDPLDWLTDTVAACVVTAFVHWIRYTRENHDR